MPAIAKQVASDTIPLISLLLINAPVAEPIKKNMVPYMLVARPALSPISCNASAVLFGSAAVVMEQINVMEIKKMIIGGGSPIIIDEMNSASAAIE